MAVPLDDSYYVSSKLDTVYKITKGAENTIEINTSGKFISIDRQNPYEYPELIKEVQPTFYGPIL